MPDAQFRPTGGAEVKFDAAELFFSRTNANGVIRSGNAVFQRISGYDWDALLGAPHNIIRHPDMPQGVFWLLWQEIKQGKPIGAYVKNRTRDGGYYWVFAIVTPIEDGFLSVRIKPTGALLKTVSNEYAALRQTERAENLKPAQSAERLLDRLVALGHQDYASFMTAAAAQEIKSRSEAIRRPERDIAPIFNTMLESVARVQDNGQRILSGFNSIRTTPMNMRIKAAHLGDCGAAIAVISMSYDTLFEEIRAGIAKFLDNANSMVATINAGLFLTCVCKLQQDVIAQFAAEADMPDIIAKAEESLLLNDQTARYRSEAAAGLRSIAAEVATFAEVCRHLKSILSGLSLTRVLCQIESCRIGDEAKSIEVIAAQLEQFQLLTTECIRAIEREISVLDCVLHRQTELRPAA